MHSITGPYLDSLPNTKKPVVCVLSGGLDSTTLLYLLVQKYSAENVHAITYFYGQKQALETELAKQSCAILGVKHKLIDISFFGEIVSPVSTNIKGSDIEMPTIQDVLGDPQPVTYLPFRNTILFSIGFAYAEAAGCEYIFSGLQTQDNYSYYDATEGFVNKLNSLASLNRQHLIKLVTPFGNISKTEEVELGIALDVNYEYTLTCYNPDAWGDSCGTCPSCAERIMAFKNNGAIDPRSYSINIDWS